MKWFYFTRNIPNTPQFQNQNENSFDFWHFRQELNSSPKHIYKLFSSGTLFNQECLSHLY